MTAEINIQESRNKYLYFILEKKMKFYREPWYFLSAIIGVFLSMVSVYSFAGEIDQFPFNQRITLNMNTNWLYSANDLLNGQVAGLDESEFEKISIPHANTILDNHLNIDVNDYRFISWYRRHFSLNSDYAGSQVFIEFEGVATVADIYVNGEFLTQHKGAYTGFTVDITDHIKFGEKNSNLIAVKVDSQRRADIPPEGGKVDYALFGGIVRDVKMILTNPLHIKDAFITTPEVSKKEAVVNTQTEIRNQSEISQKVTVVTEVMDSAGEVVASGSKKLTVGGGQSARISYDADKISNPNLWDINDPYLYSTKVTVKSGDRELDSLSIPTGLRFFAFTKEGFYLNDRKVELFGLNRHEQWPWIGRAIPNRLQARDAEILKYELGNNMVRLSHYPQDPAFIQRADEIGLLLLEELPGWQHIGDQAWQDLAKDSLKEMILRDRNHPSIISWGVRINESEDSSEFYTETNAISMELDPTRPTHGVHTNENPDGEYLENGFYGYNDYNCWDGFATVKEPRDVPWLITETNCYWKNVLPNSSDTEWVKHMKEFARIHESANKNPRILGSLGWSYVDYNTEVDYNNTSKNFYSGVYDLFRLPRFSAGFYRSQTDPEKYGPMVEIASFWTANSPTNITITSNTEEVELFLNDVSLGTKKPEVYPGLDHPLFEFAVDFEPGELRAEGRIKGEVVATDVVTTPGKAVRLELIPDFDNIVADGSDLTSITVRAVDAKGNWVPTATTTVSFNVSGAGRFVGENPIALENGRASLFVQSMLNKTGSIKISVIADGLQGAESSVEVKEFSEAIVPVARTGKHSVEPRIATEVGGYLFITFRGEATPMTEQLYFMLSDNGLNWTALNHENPVLVSTLGEKGVRDPYIIRSHDNKNFYLIATDLSINLNDDWNRAQTAGSQSIVIWESEDLVNWSEPRLVKVAPDHAGCTWAPEVIYDEKDKSYMVFWASKTADDNFAKHRIWAARTRDFKNFSEPFVYIDKPNTVIDTTIVHEGDTYYRFTKDEKTKAITMEKSKELMSSWSDVEGFSLSSLHGYEGPAAFVFQQPKDGNPARWKLLLDFYSQAKGYQTFETDNLSSGNFKEGNPMYFPLHPVRHGTVLGLTSNEYERLKDADRNHKFKVGK